MLIVPFVRVYTSGVNDAEYALPLFALLITAAHGCHCLRLPYDMLILAEGHFKQTQRCHIIAAAVNVLVSVLTVKLWGLVGVAIGTLVAMVYQTVWMAYYDAKHILESAVGSFWKHLLVDLLTVLPASLLSLLIPLRGVSYPAWILLAFEVAAVWAAVVLAVNLLFYREKLLRLLKAPFRRRGV